MKNRLKIGMELTRRQFLAALTKEDDFFIARCPELNVAYKGETLEEAERSIKEAIGYILRALGPKTFRKRFPNLI
jgi:hypothetical protein